MRRRPLVLSLVSLAGLAGLAAMFSGLDAAAIWPPSGSAAAGALLGQLSAALTYGYLRTPEMIIGLGASLALPVVALASVSVRWLARRRADHRRRTRVPGSEPGRPAAIQPGKVWLEFADHGGARALEIGGELMRIGHDADNDVALPYQGVQQFHALIRRTPGPEFVVIDVTGTNGRGIAVNGRQLRSCLLRDGDRIELGGAAVIFRRACNDRPARIAP